VSRKESIAIGREHKGEKRKGLLRLVSRKESIAAVRLERKE
jgi:hypothetical protein